jgi:F-type H+-transporting ATPase subunit b
MEIFAKLGIDWKLLLAQAVNFAILFYVLKRFAYGPLLGYMEERSRRIEEGLTDAEKAKEKLQSASEEKEAVLRAAREEAKALVAEAEAAASERDLKRSQETEARIAAMLSAAEARMAEEKKELISDAKKEVAELVVRSLDKILGPGLSEKLDEALIREHTSR